MPVQRSLEKTLSAPPNSRPTVDQSSWASKQPRDRTGFRDSRRRFSLRSMVRSPIAQTAQTNPEHLRHVRVSLTSPPPASARSHNKPKSASSFAFVPTRFGLRESRVDHEL